MESTREMLGARVRRLERTNRLLVGAVVVSLAASLMGAVADAQSSDVVRARRIQLVDDRGNVRMDLRHDSTETGLFILDEAGDTRVGVAQFAHGGGGYALHGPRGRGAAVLYLSGSGSLTMYDEEGGITARFPVEAR